jgi:hypothetical protein
LDTIARHELDDGAKVLGRDAANEAATKSAQRAHQSLDTIARHEMDDGAKVLGRDAANEAATKSAQRAHQSLDTIANHELKEGAGALKNTVPEDAVAKLDNAEELFSERYRKYLTPDGPYKGDKGFKFGLMAQDEMVEERLKAQLKKMGVPDDQISRAAKGGEGDLADLIIEKSGSIEVQGKAATDLIAISVRAKTGNATPADVALLRQLADDASRAGRNFWDDLPKMGTFSDEGFENLVPSKELIDAMKSVADKGVASRALPAGGLSSETVPPGGFAPSTVPPSASPVANTGSGTMPPPGFSKVNRANAVDPSKTIPHNEVLAIPNRSGRSVPNAVDPSKTMPHNEVLAIPNRSGGSIPAAADPSKTLPYGEVLPTPRAPSSTAAAGSVPAESGLNKALSSSQSGAANAVERQIQPNAGAGAESSGLTIPSSLQGEILKNAVMNVLPIDKNPSTLEDDEKGAKSSNE